MDWDFGNGVLTISGSGEMYNFAKFVDSETGKVTIEHPNPCIASTLHRDFTREQLELAEKEVSELRNRQDSLPVKQGQP